MPIETINISFESIQDNMLSKLPAQNNGEEGYGDYKYVFIY